MKRKKEYFHNNWEAIRDAPEEWFEDIEFHEFMAWKSNGWQLPSSIKCLIRVTNPKTKKVKEHVYKSFKRADNKVKKLIDEGINEFVVVDHDNVNHLYPISPNEKQQNSRNKNS